MALNKNMGMFHEALEAETRSRRESRLDGPFVLTRAISERKYELMLIFYYSRTTEIRNVQAQQYDIVVKRMFQFVT